MKKVSFKVSRFHLLGLQESLRRDMYDLLKQDVSIYVHPKLLEYRALVSLKTELLEIVNKKVNNTDKKEYTLKMSYHLAVHLRKVALNRACEGESNMIVISQLLGAQL